MGDRTVDRINAVLFPLLSSKWTDEEAKDFHEYISVGENDVASLHAFLLCQNIRFLYLKKLESPCTMSSLAVVWKELQNTKN